jgi:4-hydroxy-2-oxoheptanedioate aldolase
VHAARYAPDGERVACPIVRATGYWPDDWSAYAQKANREVLVLPLIEDTAAIDELEAIAAIPGVDGLFIGPYDLLVSVGVPSADFDHPKMSAAFDRAVAACRSIPSSSSPPSATARNATTAGA